LEEHIVSIFRIEEEAEQETSVKAGGKQMEAICSFETSVDFQQTTRRYIPEESTHFHLPPACSLVCWTFLRP
jgi:hypothetical protein